jgi:RNA polymerase sigma-70 factor (ECF subfamily)
MSRARSAPDPTSASGPNELPRFEDLYVQYAPFVRRVLVQYGVRPSDVDDVQQEAFVTIHRLWPSFEGRSKIETWLHAIAWRFAAQYRRKLRLELLEPSESIEAEPLGATLGVSRMYDALHRIDDEERDLILLHDIGGLSISALAELTGHARITIRQRLERGRAILVRDSGALGSSLPRVDALEGFSARSHALDEDGEPFIRVMSCGAICFATLDDMVLAVWRGQASVEGLEALSQILLDLAEEWPQGFRYLSIVEPTSKPPNREGRALHAWMARELGPKLRAFALVIDDSMLMQLVAAILNSYVFFARTPLNMRFFTSTAPAFAWLGQYGAADPSVIHARIAAMRARLDALSRSSC